MVMPSKVVDVAAAAGTGTQDGRRPTTVPAKAAASPELSDRPRRRTFTVQDKLRILGETDRAAASGGIGAILRREGVYSSSLTDWRRQRDAGAFSALSPARRGPKVTAPNPLAADLAGVRRENARLKRRLEQAEAIIEVQKKLQPSWASPCRRRTATTSHEAGAGRTAPGPRPRRRLCRAGHGPRRRLPGARPPGPTAGGTAPQAQSPPGAEHRRTPDRARPAARTALRRP